MVVVAVAAGLIEYQVYDPGFAVLTVGLLIVSVGAISQYVSSQVDAIEHRFGLIFLMTLMGFFCGVLLAGSYLRGKPPSPTFFLATAQIIATLVVALVVSNRLAQVDKAVVLAVGVLLGYALMISLVLAGRSSYGTFHCIPLATVYAATLIGACGGSAVAIVTSKAIAGTALGNRNRAAQLLAAAEAVEKSQRSGS